MMLVKEDQSLGTLRDAEWDKMPRYASLDLKWFVYLSARPGQGSYAGIKPRGDQVLCVVQRYVKAPWYRTLF